MSATIHPYHPVLVVDDEPLVLKSVETALLFAGIVTGNKQMLSLFKYAEAIAASRQPVLIAGNAKVLAHDHFLSYMASGSGEGRGPLRREPEAEGSPPIVFPKNLPTIKQATGALVDEAMKRAGGNQTVAARFLGISQQALSKRPKKQGS